MPKSEIVKTTNHSVSCQGREAPYDHPLVYLEIKEGEKQVTCPYCSRQFVLKA